MDRNIKKVIYGAEARERILAGVEKTERAVGTTLGSKGRNVSIQRNWGPPVIMHDGVTVARNIVLEDPFEDQAAQLVIDAAQNTNNEAGDGTTTATILTYAIVKEALPLVAAGTNPMDIRKEIDRLVPQIIKELKRLAKPVKSEAEMKQIAAISAASEDMGILIAKAIDKVGQNGVVTVQEGMSSSIEVEYKEGMDFAKGWVSQYLVTNQNRLETVYEVEKKVKDKNAVSDYPFIVTIDQTVNNQVLVSIAEKILSYNNTASFCVIASDFEIEAVQTMVLSKVQSNIKVVGVKAPEFGEHRTNFLNDVAALTGGKVIGGTLGIPIEKITLNDIGTCERVIVAKDQTIIVGGRGKKEDIQNQIEGIEHLLKETKDFGIKDKLQSRLAKLVGGVAVISVGAPSEGEMREKKERVFDAVNATKAAVSEGIVPGGGVALIRASRIIKDNTVGAKILKNALLYPARRLISNVGGTDPGLAIGKILEHENPNWGYNVDKEDYEDLLKNGIIDPVRVTRSALLNAASIATMLITTDCMIVAKPQTEKKDIIEGIGKL